MSSTKKLTWEMKLNHFCMRLKDRFLHALPFLQDPRPLRAIALETTTACTRKCPYCPPHCELGIPELRMEEKVFRAIISSLSSRGFSGDLFFNLYGEPLADDRLDAWMSLASTSLPKARMVVFTNGDLLTVERFLSLKKAGLGVMVLSQHSPELSPALRGVLAALQRDYPRLDCINVIDYWGQYRSEGGGVGLLNNKGGMADVKRPPYLCCCDVETAAVDCLGNVILCNNDCTSSYAFGNAGKKDFFEIWEDPVFAAVRGRIMRGEWLFDICRRCMSPEGKTVARPAGRAVRLPPAFSDMRSALKKLPPGKGGRK
jgi:hypothetical protein